MEVEPEPDAPGAWSRVDVQSDKPADLAAGTSRYIIHIYTSHIAIVASHSINVKQK